MTSPLNNLTDTWNNAGTVFTGLKYNITDTASWPTSLLMDLQVGGVSKCYVNKDGALALAAGVQFAGGLGFLSTSGTVVLVGTTLTTSNPAIDAAQTWNASGVTFTGLKLNITNTASAAGSRIIDLKVGGNSQFYVTSAGQATFSSWAPIDGLPNYMISYDGGFGFYISGIEGVRMSNTGDIHLGSPQSLGWSSTTLTGGNTSIDTFLYRDAAGILAQRFSTNAQTLRVYNTYTDSSNYERGVFDWGTTSNVLTIDVQVLGTGTQRVISIKHLDSATGAGTATFAATNCPATTLTTPYTWIKVTSSDGSTVYMPAWK